MTWEAAVANLFSVWPVTHVLRIAANTANIKWALVILLFLSSCLFDTPWILFEFLN